MYIVPVPVSRRLSDGRETSQRICSEGDDELAYLSWRDRILVHVGTSP